MGNQSSKQHLQISGGKPKKFVHWKSAERPSAPGRPILIPLSDQEPDVITLKWDRPLTDGGSQIMGYIVEHRRMGSSHWVRATPSLVPVTECAISGLEPGWRYQFRAIAENIVGKSDPSQLSDPLTVTLQRNAITVPRFAKELTNTTVEENARVEMRVAVLGHPPPEINWFKDGFEIFSSRRTKIVNDNESSVLIIHQCAFTDEGEIKCTATNRAGHVVTKAFLKIVAPPKIRLPRQYEDGLIVEAGEVLRLKVGLAGQPFPTVVWFHEGNIMRNGGRYELVTSEKNSSLKIENIMRSDRGEYSLRASNTLGEDSASFLVTVTSRPNPPGKIKLAMSFGRSATLSWIAPDDDGGCKIGSYIIEYFRLGWNVWLKASTTRKLTTTLHDLIEGSEYKFRVKAENPYGVSDPSEESDILFIPDPRRGITKPVREHVAEHKPPIPPKRRTLSPFRNFLGVGGKSSRSPSPNDRASPSRDAHVMSEMYESEQMQQEMSYGTPDNVLNTRRASSLKENRKKDSPKSIKFNEKPQMISEGTQSLGLQKNEILKPEEQTTTKEPETPRRLSVNQRFQNLINRSPSPSRRKLSLPEELSSLPVGERTKDRSPSPSRPVERKDSLIVEKVQQFFKKSPSPSRKNIKQSDNNKAASLEAMETDQISPQQSLHRKDSLIIEKVQNFFRRSSSPSPSRKIILPDSSSLPSDMDVVTKTNANTQLKENNSESNCRNPETQLSLQRVSYVNQSNNTLSQNTSEQNIANTQVYKNVQTNQSNKFNGQGNKITNQRPLLPNPTIEISAPSKDEPKMPSEYSRQDEAHTSSEFMLVLHPIKKSSDNNKQESFDLELEEALCPPPISFSVPDLSSDQLDIQMPPLRRSVSSTELLYERAMARFYEAVELEEAGKSKKQKSEEIIHQDTIRKRLGSISQEERLSFERKSSLRRRLSGEMPTTLLSSIGTKWDMKNIDLDLSKIKKEHSPIEKRNSEESVLVKNDELRKKESLEYESDYTESTASSSQDSIAKFRNELMARTRSISGELETYHPRRMEDGSFSPYRSPTPDQTAIFLTKPSPLPNPDFIPKPILKRSSTENVIKDETGKTKSEGDKHKDSGGFSFTNIFKKDKPEKNISEPQKLKVESKETSEDTSKNISQEINQKENTIEEKLDSSVLQQKSIEEIQKKKLQQRQSSEDETKVVVEHYSDIVRELGSGVRRRGVPLYMRGGMYSTKSDEETEKAEEEEKRKMEEKAEREFMAKAHERPRLSIVERLQSAHVQNRSKAAMERLPSDDSEKEHAAKIIKEIEQKEIENEGSRSRPLTINKNKGKKGTLSNSVNRDRSSSRPKISESNKENTSSTPVQRRTTSRTRNRAESKSPAVKNRKVLLKSEETVSETIQDKSVAISEESTEKNRSKTPEELYEEAQENAKSTFNYIIDVGLFTIACWVYIFKDARLVLPILALLVYRQLGEALNNKIPDWMKKKKN